MKLLRYSDLVERGLFRSRMTLRRAIAEQGFPAGILLTPNCRVWAVAEIDAYVASRPSGKKTVGKKAGSGVAAHPDVR